MKTVWRVDLDTDANTYETRKQLPARSHAEAQRLYMDLLAQPPAEYATVALIRDCRLQKRQMLHGDQEHIS